MFKQVVTHLGCPILVTDQDTPARPKGGPLMKKGLRVLADDIALGLTRELRGQRERTRSGKYSIADSLVDRVADEVLERISGSHTSPYIGDESPLERLDQVEEKLERLTSGFRGPVLERLAGDESALDGEGAKYQNVESLIKYMERSESGGGLKLVIMNFND